MPVHLIQGKTGYELVIKYKNGKNSETIGVITVDDSQPLLDPQTFEAALQEAQVVISAETAKRRKSARYSLNKSKEA